ncbi:hypothetical protein BP5796_01331 [Coleophoma crateriformis]|uniref:Uncharacterized protein n=1 Tax=Coleophoma crateriformis TaxID=565419 RepID=A0A3D8T034_9HELO|nr:hypothetical protein BP5796_01331 [Coleophoma crateriformis]
MTRIQSIGSPAWEARWRAFVEEETIGPHYEPYSVVVQDISQSQSRTSESLQDITTLQRRLAEPMPENSLRVIYLHQSYGWGKLNVSEEMLREIVVANAMSLEVLDTLSLFRPRVQELEEAFCGSSWNRRNGSVQEFAYTFKYPEQKIHPDIGVMWSIRQTGIYHRYDAQSGKNVVLYLSSSPTSPALARGRAYFDELAGDEITISDVQDVQSASVTTALLDNDLKFGHTTLVQLRHIENQILPLGPIFQSALKTLQDMREKTSMNLSAVLAQDNENLQGLVLALNKNLNFLLQRLSGTSVLASETLNLKLQSLAKMTSDNGLSLTKAAIKDSQTIRIITVMTLLYLPSSFVASLFGMNFFSFNAADKLLLGYVAIKISAREAGRSLERSFKLLRDRDWRLPAVVAKAGSKLKTSWSTKFKHATHGVEVQVNGANSERVDLEKGLHSQS